MHRSGDGPSGQKVTIGRCPPRKRRREPTPTPCGSLSGALARPEPDSLTRLTLATARKLVVLTLGGTIVALGLALLVLPGPGLLVVGIGVALLATEFVWARRLLARLRSRARAAGNALGVGGEPPPADAAPPGDDPGGSPSGRA